MRKLVLTFFIALSVSGLGISVLSPVASAISGSEFRAGSIIDDGVFFNPNGMDTGTIQNFLNSKVPNCDSAGSQIYSGSTTRAAYGASKGYPAPYTCLKDYVQATPTVPGQPGLCNTYPGGTKTSAQIIYDVAQACGVNAKVLLILLEKEQSLVTDNWPFPTQYTKATGYGCPDSDLPVNVDANRNGCYDEYEGFFTQVYNGAKQYKNYGLNATSFRYRAGRDNYIQYNPNGACGGSNVFIQNQATAGLYNYTPYQPNPAALSVVTNDTAGGTVDCGAYGNRNFWWLFTKWFGSTQSDISISNVAWKYEELDGTAASVSKQPGNLGNSVATVQYGAVLHTFYYDKANRDLKHSWADNTGWHFETLDGLGGAGGKTTHDVGLSVTAKVVNNKLYVGYYDATNYDLRLATMDGASNWTYETLDGASTDLGRLNVAVGQDISISNLGSTVQVLYSDQTNGDLRHAWNDVTGWHFETLDGAPSGVSREESNAGQNVKVTEFGGTLQVLYYDAGRGNLKHAWADTRGWHFEHLDGDPNAISRTDGNVGAFENFASVGGTLQAFYYDVGRGNLKHAWADTRGWHFEHLDGDPNAISRSEGNVGYSPQIASLNNKLYVTYGNPERGLVKQGWSDASGWHFAEIDGSYTSVSRNGSHPVSSANALVPFGNDLQLFYFDTYSGSLRHTWGTPQN